MANVKHDITMADIASHEEVSQPSLSAHMGHVTRRINEVEQSTELLRLALNPTEGSVVAEIVKHLAKTLESELDALMAAAKVYSDKLTNYCVTTDPADPFNSDRTKDARDKHDLKSAKVKTTRIGALVQLSKVPEVTASTRAQADDEDDGDSDGQERRNNNTGKPVQELKPRNLLPSSPSAKEVTQFLKDFIPYYDSGVKKATAEQQRVYLANCMDPALWSLLETYDTAPETHIDPRNTTTGLFRALIKITGEADGGLTNKRCEWHRMEQAETGGTYEKWSELDARLRKIMIEIDYWQTSHDKLAAARYIAAVKDPKLLEKLFELRDPSLADVRRVGENYQDHQTSLEVHYKIMGKTKSKSTVPVTMVMAKEGRKCMCCAGKVGYRVPKTAKYPLCLECYKDIQKPTKERIRISKFNCHKCNTRGNHKQEMCTGIEIPGPPNPSGQPRGRPKDRDSRQRSPSRSQSRGSSRASSGGSRQRGGRRGTPTAASKRHQTNFIGVAQVMKAEDNMLDTDVGFYNVRIRNKDTLEELNDFKRQAIKVTKDNADQKIVIQEVVEKLNESAPNETVQATRAQHKTHTPWKKRVKRNRFRRTVWRARYNRTKPRKQTDRASPGWYKVMSLLITYLLMPLISVYKLVSRGAERVPAGIKPGKDKRENIQVTISTVNVHAGKVELLNTKVEEAAEPLDNMHVLVGVTEHEIRQRDERMVVPTAACPDTGAGRSVCGPDLIEALEAETTTEENVTITAANGMEMSYEGSANLRVKFEDQLNDIKVLVSKSVKGRLIIGKPDLIRMRVIPPHFPCVIPQEAYRILLD